MNVFCIVMFKFNYSVRDIKNSDLGEGIVCLGEGSGGKGGGKWGKGGGNWGKRGRDVGVRGREVGNAYSPVHPPLHCVYGHIGIDSKDKFSNFLYVVFMLMLIGS